MIDDGSMSAGTRTEDDGGFVVPNMTLECSKGIVTPRSLERLRRSLAAGLRTLALVISVVLFGYRGFRNVTRTNVFFLRSTSSTVIRVMKNSIYPHIMIYTINDSVVLLHVCID